MATIPRTSRFQFVRGISHFLRNATSIFVGPSIVHFTVTSFRIAARTLYFPRARVSTRALAFRLPPPPQRVSRRNARCFDVVINI